MVQFSAGSIESRTTGAFKLVPLKRSEPPFKADAVTSRPAPGTIWTDEAGLDETTVQPGFNAASAAKLSARNATGVDEPSISSVPPFASSSPALLIETEEIVSLP